MPFVPGSQIEIVDPGVVRGRIRYALFDFDGTISLIREGWQGVMVPMMVELLLATPGAEDEAAITSRVREFVARLTGRQTIYQMIQLAEEVRARGGRPLEPLDYKRMYHERLWQRIAGRVAALEAGQATPDDLMVPGSRAMLEGLACRGVRMYLASGTDEPFVRHEAELSWACPATSMPLRGAGRLPHLLRAPGYPAPHRGAPPERARVRRLWRWLCGDRGCARRGGRRRGRGVQRGRAPQDRRLEAHTPCRGGGAGHRARLFRARGLECLALSRLRQIPVRSLIARRREASSLCDVPFTERGHAERTARKRQVGTTHVARHPCAIGGPLPERERGRGRAQPAVAQCMWGRDASLRRSSVCGG